MKTDRHLNRMIQSETRADGSEVMCCRHRAAETELQTADGFKFVLIVTIAQGRATTPRPAVVVRSWRPGVLPSRVWDSSHNPLVLRR